MSKELKIDQIKAPKWMTEEFIQMALQHYKADESLIVKSVEITPGAPPENHYSSIMFKAKVEFDSKKLSNQNMLLILKTIPASDELFTEISKGFKTFETEMRFYGETLPEMERLFAEADDATIISPRLIYQSNEPAPVIILLDETPNGFVPCEKTLSLENCKIVATRIAKFHACSLYMNENGFKMSKFDYSFCEIVPNKTDFMKEFMAPTLQGALYAVKLWDDQPDLYEKLAANLPTTIDRIRDLYNNRDKHRYRVLNHGDFHFKNLMYRNSGNTSEDLLLHDYQMCLWNSPAIDVLYFFYGVCTPEVHEKHREELVYFYFTEFIATLKKLKYSGDMPKLLDLQIDLLRFGIIEIMLAVLFVPWNFIDWSAIDLSEMMSKKNFFTAAQKAWQNENFKKHMAQIFQRLINLGVLE